MRVRKFFVNTSGIYTNRNILKEIKNYKISSNFVFWVALALTFF